jgi:hypothetical protein
VGQLRKSLNTETTENYAHTLAGLAVFDLAEDESDRLTEQLIEVVRAYQRGDPS